MGTAVASNLIELRFAGESELAGLCVLMRNSFSCLSKGKDSVARSKPAHADTVVGRFDGHRCFTAGSAV